MKPTPKRPWLAGFLWEFVIYQNNALCDAKDAHHGPTSDGYSDTEKFWAENFEREFEVPDVMDFLCRCHRMAPFTNFNGNTFAAIARIIVEDAGFSAQNSVLARSLAGHIVAGVAGNEEIEAFQKLCEERYPSA